MDHNLYSGSLSLSRSGRLQKAASIEVLDLPDQEAGSATLSSTKPVQISVLEEIESLEPKEIESPVPSRTVTTSKESSSKEPDPVEKTTQVEKNTDSKAAQTSDSGSDSVADSGMGSVSNKAKTPDPPVRRPCMKHVK